MKILIELPTWLGDTVMATPAIENLVNHFSDVEITLLGSFVSIEILKNHPKVNKTYVLDKKFVNLYETLKNFGGFDVFFSFRRSFRSKFIKFCISSKSKYKFDKRKYNFEMIYKGKSSGFGFSTPKVGATASGEANNGNLVRRVQLPNSYFVKIGSVQNEIKDAGVKAINAQKYALKVKKQYISKICKESVSVNFMDNNEYKKICSDSSELKIKMSEKLEKINKLKHQKREQQHKEKLFIAKQKQVQAAENQKAWSDLNQAIKDATPKTTQTNCYNTFGGVNCNSTTY